MSSIFLVGLTGFPSFHVSSDSREAFKLCSLILWFTLSSMYCWEKKFECVLPGFF